MHRDQIFFEEEGVEELVVLHLVYVNYYTN